MPNPQSNIGNHNTHPLPRGGTDFMTHDRVMTELRESQPNRAERSCAGESIDLVHMSIGVRK